MNYYQEPVYALKVYDEIAVLYTPMITATCGRSASTRRATTTCAATKTIGLTAINEQMFDKRDVYFRNLEPKPLSDSYKFGTNIILHLLTRWDEKMRNVPMGL